MNGNQLFEFELERYDWENSIEAHGCARDVPLALRELVNSENANSAEKAYWKLENHVFIQGGLFESAVLCVPVILAALTDRTRPPLVKNSLLDLLFLIVNGESHADEEKRGVADLGPRCRDAAKTGLWLLYEYAIHDECHEAAIEVLDCIDEEKVRVSKAQERGVKRKKN